MAHSLSGTLHEPRFFAGGRAGAAELKLGYAFEQNLEVALLIGDAGLGKTTLLRRLADRIAGRGYAVIDVFYPQLDADGLLSFIASELDDEPITSHRRDELLRRIAASAQRLASQNKGFALLIDDAHLMADPAAIECLHLLLNLRQREGVRMMILLAGQRSLLANLSRVSAFAQRVGITSTLLPFNTTEAIAYTRHLLQSGEKDSIVIEDDALAAIPRLTGGIPRAINRLCEMATIVAAANGTTRLTLADLQTVFDELPRLSSEAA
jgi:type II secretory pathway predicted ATPase ExeA